MYWMQASPFERSAMDSCLVSGRRVDVHIASSDSARVLRPSVLLELTLTDGRIQTMSLTLEAFHKLRYSVAKVRVSSG